MKEFKDPSHYRHPKNRTPQPTLNEIIAPRKNTSTTSVTIRSINKT